jgi:flagellar protein FliS
MTRRATRQYRKVQLESAPPQRVLLEIYRRLDEDLQAARRCIAARDIQGKARAVDHALALLGQLEGALDHGLAPALCQDLAAAYAFCRNRMLLASVQLDPAPLSEIEQVLRPIREAFAQVIDPTPPGP